MNTEKEKALASFHWLDSQRIIFLICFLAGAIGMISLRALGFSVIYAVIFAALVMLTYILTGATKKYLIRPDLLGDNTYYLGFLFTLVSLAYTLYKYSSNENEVEAIIHNFGVALATTLLGLVGRVYFIQVKEDPAVFEKAVRISLTDQASTLIGVIADIRVDLLTMKTSIQQSIQEGVSESMDTMTKSMLEASESYKSDLQKNSEKLHQVLTENLTSFQEVVKASNDSIKENNSLLLKAVTEFKDASSSLTNELKDFTIKLQSIESIDDIFQKNLVEPLGKFQGVITDVENKFQQSCIAIDGFVEKSNEANIAIKNMTDSGVKEFTSQIDSLKQILISSVQDIKLVSSSFEMLSKELAKDANLIPDELKKFHERYKDFNNQISQAASDSQNSLLMLQKSLVTLANKLVDGVNKHG
jgi:hypothetical protein